MSLSMIWDHLSLVLSALVLSVAAGVPLGLLAYLSPKFGKLILWVVDLIQTIPALALLGLIMVVMDPGSPTAMLGLALYSLLPIVRNTCLGLQEVPPGLKEAARGCGMSRMGQLFLVEIPNALPMIFTGIRIAVVSAIGTAVFAAFVGGGGLGTTIYQGIRTRDMSRILVPTAALMGIALLFDTVMGRMEKLMDQGGEHKRGQKVVLSAAAVLVAAVLVGGTALYAGGRGEGTLVMYDGEYSETQLLTHMAKLLVEEHTDCLLYTSRCV